MNAVEAAKAYVKTYFDNSDLAKGIRSAQGQLSSLGSGMMSVGGQAIAAAAPILGVGVAAVKSFADASGAITDMSTITGIGVESLSELTYASTRLGSDIESLNGALKKQTMFMGQVAEGGKAAHATLAELGISASELEGLTADQQFGVFADAIAGIGDHTKKANLAMAVFGKSGADLLPMLNEGSAGMAEMRQEARDLGLVLSESSVAAGDELSDALDVLGFQMTALWSGAGAALVPMLSQLLEVVTPLISETITWVQQNGPLIAQVFAIAAGVAAAGAGIAALGMVATALSAILGGVLTVGGLVAGAFSALLSPMGLVVAGVVGLIAYSTDLSAAWDWLASSLGDSLGIAFDLVMNGDLSLAMELLWAQIQVTWSEGIKWIVSQTGEMVRMTLGVIAEAADRIGRLMQKTSSMLARHIVAAGEATGVIPEGSSETLAEMQESGQVGQSAMQGLAQSLQASADGFENLGGNVDELKAKLAAIKGQAVEANTAADLRRSEKQNAVKKAPATGDDDPKPIVKTGASALAGTFSSVASRQLFSGGGGVVETELKEINRNTAATASAVKQKVRVGA